jgi:hypothetical protein
VEPTVHGPHFARTEPPTRKKTAEEPRKDMSLSRLVPDSMERSIRKRREESKVRVDFSGNKLFGGRFRYLDATKRQKTSGILRTMSNRI